MVSADCLKKTELFETLDESQLSAILSHSRVEFCPEGRIIFQEGEEANHLYVLIERYRSLREGSGKGRLLDVQDPERRRSVWSSLHPRALSLQCDGEMSHAFQNIKNRYGSSQETNGRRSHAGHCDHEETGPHLF